ncbi:hypothetical protein Hypma_006002 [Hypsizygus marmoreus]|uniref:CCHC-type domain-containing protein n=1 Tax=Hypsizygus marmoreus TaxID=39966 RepID=A0A369KG05_HYPMA|nr:hypothetical protein Hypma_006002 [Hypsizygus marmoreus]
MPAERNTNLYTPRGPPNMAQRFTTPTRDDVNPFLTNTPVPPGLLFHQCNNLASPQTPSCPGNEELARRAVDISTTYLTTKEGIEAYNRTLLAWESQHSPAHEVDFVTPPYPLTPGTVNIRSKECFRCGQKGHYSRECQVEEARQVNPREQHWRAKIGRLLYMTKKLTDTAGISQINATEDIPLPYELTIYDAASLNFEDYDDSGNGQESRA